MKSEQYEQNLKSFLEDFQEKVKQPKLQRLNYIVDSRKKKTKLKEQFAWLGLK